MGRRGHRRPPWIVAVVVLLGLASSCSREEGPRVDAKLSGAGCRSACAALVTAGCTRTGLLPSDQSACVRSCQRAGAVFERADCARERHAYLACVSKTRLSCETLSCSAATCIEQGTGLSACMAHLGAYRKCVAPCSNAGTMRAGSKSVEHSGHTQTLLYELTGVGCEACPEAPGRGAPDGVACTAASVCAPVCCDCAKKPGRFFARVCLGGACLVGSEACQRLGAPPDVCE